MPDSPTSEPESVFVCDCEKLVRSACAGEAFYRQLDGKRFCVLHFPGKEKSADFEAALQRKLENQDFDFRGVWFPNNVVFREFEFRTFVDFSWATFVEGVDFLRTSFGDNAHFLFTHFQGEAIFDGVTFSGSADFAY